MSLWDELKKHTLARIGLNRVGHSIGTSELIDFQLAHAEAKDTVHQTWNFSLAQKQLEDIGEHPLIVHTTVDDRELYLKNPDSGRHLDSGSLKTLKAYAAKESTDVVFIISDGLSTKAMDAHLLPFWKILRNALKEHLGDLKIALVLAPFGRVALSDDLGKALKAKMSVMIVGERPGLSSADSLGIYLTYDPKPGNSDANRNCISNIHPPSGLDYCCAVDRLIALMEDSFRLKLSGFSLKENGLSKLE